jgi:outer membrane protein TolC
MIFKQQTGRQVPIHPITAIRAASLAALLPLVCAPAHAQISFTSAIDLALKNSPRIKMVQADLDRARASHEEAKDVYIPSISGSTGALGYGRGFPLGTPVLYSVSAQSLVFSFSQRDYIRAAADGIAASTLALRDTWEQVAEETATTYIALDQARRKRDALVQEAAFAERLEAIVKDRLDAGQDTAMEYHKARRTNAQVHLALLQIEDEVKLDTDKLALLIGLPAPSLGTVPESVPAVPASAPIAESPGTMPDPPSVQAAFATARSRQEQAFGDSRYMLRPQFAFGANYSKLSTYNNSYTLYYPSVQGGNPFSPSPVPLKDTGVGFSISVTLPILDLAHRARAHESLADAAHAQHVAEDARIQAIEGRLRLDRSAAELAVRAELAADDRDLAQDQLDVVLLQLQQTPSGAAPATTPKDEQNARIAERQRFIDMLDAQGQLLQTRISLLRQSGQLEDWLRTAPAPPTLTVKPAP